MHLSIQISIYSVETGFITGFVWVPELSSLREKNPLKFYESPDEDGSDKMF